MSDEMKSQEECDFHALVKAEEIKADKARHKKAVEYSKHAKPVYSSIEDMGKAWQEERNKEAVEEEDDDEEEEEFKGHPLEGKDHPVGDRKSYNVKLTDKMNARDEKEKGKNGPTGDKIHDELPSKKAALKAIKRPYRG